MYKVWILYVDKGYNTSSEIYQSEDIMQALASFNTCVTLRKSRLYSFDVTDIVMYDENGRAISEVSFRSK